MNLRINNICALTREWTSSQKRKMNVEVLKSRIYFSILFAAVAGVSMSMKTSDKCEFVYSAAGENGRFSPISLF